MTAGGSKRSSDPLGGDLNVGWINDGSWICWNQMNLLNITSVTYRIASAGTGGQIEIHRNRRESARATILVLDAAFQPLAVQELALVLANRDAGIEAMRRSARRTDAAIWQIDDVRVPVAGRWNLRLELLINDFEKVAVEDTVTLPQLP